MRKVSVIIALILFPLFITACASSGARQKQLDRMTLIETKLTQIVDELTALKETSDQNSSAIAALNQQFQDSFQDLRTEGAKNSVLLETLERKIEALAERVDDSEVRIGTIRKELNSIQLSRRGSNYERPYESGGTQTQDDSSNTSTDDQTRTTTPSNESEAFQVPYSDYLRGQFGFAVAGFRNYLRNYPQGSRSEEAHFYLAESLYNLEDYEGSVEEYDNVIRSYPNSPNRVSAIYKKGLAFLNSNQTAQGVILLQQLINRYPDTNEARLAREKLRTLGLNP